MTISSSLIIWGDTLNIPVLNTVFGVEAQNTWIKGMPMRRGDVGDSPPAKTGKWSYRWSDEDGADDFEAHLNSVLDRFSEGLRSVEVRDTAAKIAIGVIVDGEETSEGSYAAYISAALSNPLAIHNVEVRLTVLSQFKTARIELPCEMYSSNRS